MQLLHKESYSYCIGYLKYAGARHPSQDGSKYHPLAYTELSGWREMLCVIQKEPRFIKKILITESKRVLLNKV